MGENHFSFLQSAPYGAVLRLAAVAYYILQTLIVAAAGGCESKLAAAIGKDWKGKLSPVLYAIAIVVSLFLPGIAQCIFIVVALMWLIPDRRLGRRASERDHAAP